MNNDGASILGHAVPFFKDSHGTLTKARYGKIDPPSGSYVLFMGWLSNSILASTSATLVSPSA